MTDALIDDPIISLPAGATPHPLVLAARADAGAPAPSARTPKSATAASQRRRDATTTLAPEELLPLLTSDAYTRRRQGVRILPV